ncbi:hypothetical protein CPB83DRAFT_900745 [Crepidotus variabilis]|uniref:Uncharacterized protein n=1 Tax=Crepidotus variabilis TaxID=179855 RepID=A0A9P6E2N4_9AGAR|nr:hypothetical protein CPB83DRAFT_900745 [Crepidotus variabilis]
MSVTPSKTTVVAPHPPPKAPPKLIGNGKGVIVKQASASLYNTAGDEALNKIIDTHFDEYEWILVKTFDNTLAKKDLEGQHPLDTKRVITSGADANNNWDFVSEVNRLKIHYDDTTKIFVDSETKSPTEQTVAVIVPAGGVVHLYQKRYKFTAKVWFILDARGHIWTVGNWRRSGIPIVTGTYYVDSNEYTAHSSALSDTKNLVVTKGTISHDPTFNILQFENCTQRCQDYLRSRGV